MKLDSRIFLDSTIPTDRKVAIECKLPTGACNDQTVQVFDCIESMLAYADMDLGKYSARWFAFLALKKGNHKANNAGGEAYIALYDQTGVYDAGLRLKNGEKLKAFRLRRGVITPGVMAKDSLRQSMRNACIAELKIPVPAEQATEEGIKALCADLAGQRAKFLNLSEEATPARGFELLTAMLLLNEYGVITSKHTGDNTKNRGADLQQRNDVVISVKSMRDCNIWH